MIESAAAFALYAVVGLVLIVGLGLGIAFRDFRGGDE